MGSHGSTHNFPILRVRKKFFKEFYGVLLTFSPKIAHSKISQFSIKYTNSLYSVLTTLEDYIEAISAHNLNDGLVMSNSMFVVDDEKQRKKMTEEFYANYKRDNEFYQKRIQNLIENGCDSKTVIDRGLKRSATCRRKRLYMRMC